MKDLIAFIICGISGIIILVAFFLNDPRATQVQDILDDWVVIISGFAFLMGGLSVLINHIYRVNRRSDGWGYSIVLIVCLVGMAILGIFFDYSEAGLFQWLYKNVQNPMQATMFAFLAFYVASASYRAFRVRNWMATLLFISAIIVMIGSVPIGESMWSKFPVISQWILNVPSLAAQRALLIGAALGLVATGLKTLLGIERSWLGR